MATEHGQVFCQRCNQHTAAVRQGPLHVVHALISIFTLGLWVFVWLFACLSKNPWRCGVCGWKQGGSINTLVGLGLIVVGVPTVILLYKGIGSDSSPSPSPAVATVAQDDDPAAKGREKKRRAALAKRNAGRRQRTKTPSSKTVELPGLAAAGQWIGGSGAIIENQDSFAWTNIEVIIMPKLTAFSKRWTRTVAKLGPGERLSIDFEDCIDSSGNRFNTSRQFVGYLSIRADTPNGRDRHSWTRTP